MKQRQLAVIALATTLGVAVPASLLAQNLPRLSPPATVAQTLGVTRIEIGYGRPAVRGRVIWGELVPWNQVWRTGANEATTIDFSHDVKIDGRDLAAGRYALFTLPDETEWTVIFNRVPDQWGAFNYDQGEDALRIPVKPRNSSFQERFEISFPEVGADTLVVTLRWAETEIPFTVQVDVEATTVAEARAFVAAAGPGDGRAVWNWANHLYQQGWALEEALEWASTLSAEAPMYWTHALEARILAKIGRMSAARDAAQVALKRAESDAEQPGVTADAEGLAEELAGWSGEGG